MNKKNQDQEYICESENNGERIDIFISKILNCSRNQASNIIEQHSVFLNNKIIQKKNTHIYEKDIIKIIYIKNDLIKAKNINIDDIKIIYSDENFVFINKPPFLSVHTANNNDKNYTLMHFCKDNSFWNDSINDPEEYRYGIVHRLDKETSGVICIARNLNSYNSVKSLFEKRLIEKEYIAFVYGKLTIKEGLITKNIIRDPLNPTQMAYSSHQGRIAETYYKVIKENENFSVLSCFPKTGRTHQIRIHMLSIGHPILSDKTYGKESKLIDRQALHAKSIKFVFNEKEYFFEADLLNDMLKLL